MEPYHECAAYMDLLECIDDKCATPMCLKRNENVLCLACEQIDNFCTKEPASTFLKEEYDKWKKYCDKLREQGFCVEQK